MAIIENPFLENDDIKPGVNPQYKYHIPPFSYMY